MFGELINVKDNYVIIENKSKIIDSNYLNLHVIFTENNRRIVGEIISIDKNTINILLIGEIINDSYVNGIVKKPNLSNGCRIIYKSELELLLGSQDIDNKNNFYIGKSILYDGYNITANFNDFFSNHFAIIGNTGSGKRCSVARIIQNLFNKNTGNLPKKSHIVFFDVYGEYNNAYNNFNNVEGLGFKSFSALPSHNSEIINIPAYFLSVDALAILLDVPSHNQLPILEKTIKLVYIYKNTDETICKF